MKIVILAAGIGSRLGNPFPKPLTTLSNGKSIMQMQIDNLTAHFDVNDIYVVIGFKKDMIMELFPQLTYIYNPFFDQTNTSKSLLSALHKFKGESVLWLNGDVIFESDMLKRLKPIIDRDQSFIAVNTEKVGEEEVKYTLQNGHVNQLSKQVENALGEAGESPRHAQVSGRCGAGEHRGDFRHLLPRGPAGPSFHLQMGPPGSFGSRRSPRTFWIGFLPGPGLDLLKEVQGRLEEALVEEGFPAEDRRWSPHLTLGRNPRHQPAEGWDGLLPPWIGGGAPGFEAETLCLLSSELTPKGPIYSMISRSPFTGGSPPSDNLEKEDQP